MRISDWSSDVCSSDLVARLQRDVQGLAGRLHAAAQLAALGQCHRLAAVLVAVELDLVVLVKQRAFAGQRQQRDRKSVVSGKSVSVRVDLGGRRIIKKKNNESN